MSKFVKLTDAKTSQPIYLNLENIVSFEDKTFDGRLFGLVTTTSNDEEYKRIRVSEKSLSFTKLI